MTRLKLLAVVAALVACSAVASLTDAAVLFGGGSNSRSLYTIDLITGERKPVPIMDPFFAVPQGISGLAYNSNDGFLYASLQLSPAGLGQIYQINRSNWTTGYRNVTGIPFTELEAHIAGLEYDPVRNSFWGTLSDGSSRLISIDAATWQGQIVGDFNQGTAIGGIALDSANDILYGVRDGFDPAQLSSLVVIDRRSGRLQFTPIGPPGLGLNLYDLDSLAFNPEDRKLYAINDGSIGPGPHQRQLVRIDPSTGIASLVGSPSGILEGWQGLAFVIPEPCMAHSLVVGGILLGACRFRSSGGHSSTNARKRSRKKRTASSWPT